MNLVQGVQSVQPLTLSPTAIDAPILQKPNSASVVSAISALSSHVNDVKSDSRENNIECLQTINTLLNQISAYFNGILSESVGKLRVNGDGSLIPFYLNVFSKKTCDNSTKQLQVIYFSPLIYYIK